jgi:hypothetical protein
VRLAPLSREVIGVMNHGQVSSERLRCAAVMGVSLTCVCEPLRQEPAGGKLEHVSVAAGAVVGGHEVVADHE